ncbi:MAG: glycosyltransferase [Bacteroidaceae bacterium]|nr:glycosyltransferase [Bacteroidaceae bacterium]
MNIPAIYYILSAVYLPLWLFAMLQAYRYRRVQKLIKNAEERGMQPNTPLPGMSIVLTTHDQVDELRRHLPLFLEQDYPGNYELIVADMNSKDETRDYLESMQGRYPHLHVSLLPDTVRNISPIQLALTLGIRSASHDWIVLTQADCHPASPAWLRRLGETCAQNPKREIVLGRTRFTGGKGWQGLRCRFFRTWQQMLHLPYAQRYRAYRADVGNLCYRRSLFLRHKGFADNSTLLLGATDIMVNRNSTRANTAVCLHPDAVVLQDTPRSTRWWKEERLFFMETRRHFAHGAFYRLQYFTSVSLTWLFTLATVGTVLTDALLLHDYKASVVAAVLWLVHAVFRAVCFNKGAKAMGEASFFPLLPLLLHLVPLWDTAAWLRWRVTPRRMFRKKFI